MTETVNRRLFLSASAAAAATIAVPSARAAGTKRNIKKTLKLGMIASEGPDKRKLTIGERMQIAADAGFDAVEPDTIFDPEQLEATINAADKAGVALDAIICSRHWSKPLSHPDPNVRAECVEAMKVSMQNAKAMGGDMVLLVPAVVNPGIMYKDAWERSLRHVKELAEYAEDLHITIGLENVWNKFLLSPLEFLHYLDEVGSPRVKAWFDVGNILLYGYPQDWIRTLGDQIARVDVKDFKTDNFSFTPLLDGSTDWPEVMKAFDEIGYEGYFAAEVQGGGLDYLKPMVSERMDRIIAM